jgi:hypothetical protein
MGKITVTVDAEGQDSFTFSWEGGGVRDLKDIIDDIKDVAQPSGLDPVQFAKRASADIPSVGLLPEPVGTVQRLTILFAVLDYLNTRADELPEPVLDCLAECNTVESSLSAAGSAQ